MSFIRYKSRTRLVLPFSGAWYVVWGGVRRKDNLLHVVARDQRFATDFVIIHEGSSHRRKGIRNIDYYCWNKLVTAPGGGIIVQAVDGIADNRPGYMNARQPLGNHIILDHECGEYSFLAHLKKGTLQVKIGDRVAVGTPLGNCGNSGNSSEPHLHYHMQNSPSFGKGDGLPAHFLNYFADGRRVRAGLPRRGQVLHAA